jgi:hypothetical protein
MKVIFTVVETLQTFTEEAVIMVIVIIINFHLHASRLITLTQMKEKGKVKPLILYVEMR